MCSLGFITWGKWMKLNTALSGNIVFSSFIFKFVVEFNTYEFEWLINSIALKWSLQISPSALAVFPLLLVWAALGQRLIMGVVVCGVWNLKQSEHHQMHFSLFPQGLNLSSRSMNLVFSLCRSQLQCQETVQWWSLRFLMSGSSYGS